MRQIHVDFRHRDGLRNVNHFLRIPFTTGVGFNVLPLKSARRPLKLMRTRCDAHRKVRSRSRSTTEKAVQPFPSSLHVSGGITFIAHLLAALALDLVGGLLRSLAGFSRARSFRPILVARTLGCLSSCCSLLLTL